MGGKPAFWTDPEEGKEEEREEGELALLNPRPCWHHLTESPQQPFKALHPILPTLQMRKLHLEKIDMSGPRQPARKWPGRTVTPGPSGWRTQAPTRAQRPFPGIQLKLQ